MILLSAGLAAAAAAAAVRRRGEGGGDPRPFPTPDLTRLLWGEAVAAIRAARAQLRRGRTLR